MIDANLLLYAADERSPWHRAASVWLERTLGGRTRVGMPWQSLGAFLRISTHPSAFENPLTSAQAWAAVEDWLGSEGAWVPAPTDRHAEILGGLITTHHLRGNLISDADLAALAIEHGLTLYSTDTDFARFPEVRWENPVA